MQTNITKILKELAIFANGHKQIVSYRTEPITENTAKGLSYPLMWVDLTEMNVAFDAGELVIDLPIYILDRLKRDYSNVVGVLSDTLLILDDLITMYCDNSCELGFNLEYTSDATPVIFEFDDLTAGYSAILKCHVGTSHNQVQVPM